MKNPLVSIIITTKNEEGNITRLLKSIKNQSYQSIETIVVDNYSVDRTVTLAKEFTNKVYSQGPERSAQRNFGAEKAKGEFFLILDADMELTKNVVKSCIEKIDDHSALIVPEKTVGESFMAKVRAFEREMYMGDPDVEVARFFKAKVFEEFGGYDTNLTGAEDYDLPHRIRSKYTIGWAKDYLLHHEQKLSLARQIKKKFYYAKKSASYADKHPDLVRRQGILIWRRAYLRHWKRFFKNPHLGVALLFVRGLETIAAAVGYISEVGIIKFGKTLVRIFER